MLTIALHEHQPLLPVATVCLSIFLDLSASSLREKISKYQKTHFFPAEMLPIPFNFRALFWVAAYSDIFEKLALLLLLLFCYCSTDTGTAVLPPVGLKWKRAARLSRPVQRGAVDDLHGAKAETGSWRNCECQTVAWWTAFSSNLE